MSKFVKLSSIAELTVGFVGTMAKHYEDEGIPFLRSLNIKPFKIISDDMKYVSAEFSNSLSKSILHKGDVVIVRTGIPGTCCVVPAEYDGCNCSDVVIVHPNTELVNPHYLAAYINFWGQRQIQNNKVGAIQQHFNVHSAEDIQMDTRPDGFATMIMDELNQDKVKQLKDACHRITVEGDFVKYENVYHGVLTECSSQSTYSN